MSFRYDSPPINLPLKQGEVIGNLLELPPTPSDIETLRNEEEVPSVFRRTHPIAAVITQDCDLYWDWKFRTSPELIKKNERDENKWLLHIQFCELFEKDNIRLSRGFNSKLWERVTSGQDERYHRFNQARIGDAEADKLPDLYIDFKRVFSLPTDYVLWLISSGFSIRKAIIPDPYLRDFIQRLFSYLSRVAIPEDDIT